VIIGEKGKAWREPPRTDMPGRKKADEGIKKHLSAREPEVSFKGEASHRMEDLPPFQ
jgi:hypothetical protein